MKDRKNWIIFLSLIVTAFLFYINYKSKHFFEFTLYELLTLLFFVLITYFYAEYLNAKENSKNQVEKLLVKIQNEIQKIDDVCLDSIEITMIQRTISNLINILESISYKNLKDNDLQYIKKEFIDYKTFYGNHISDLEYLRKSTMEIKKYKKNIDNKIDMIVTSFYCDFK